MTFPARVMLTVVACLFATPRVEGTGAGDRAADLVSRLRQDPAVVAALADVEASEGALLDDQARICEVPAPPFNEGARAALFKRLLEETGLPDVSTDRVGNVVAARPGRAPRPHVVISAHLDTVFPEGTDVRVTREGTTMKGPGIGDDCRGLAVVLGIARALNRARVVTPGTISFVGTVGEEGLGDLRGVKALFNETLRGRIDRFVSIDGAGYGITRVGVGSRRYRFSFRGPGGHSFGAFGTANPVHALGRAIAQIADLQVPASPRTTFNVGRVGGGTSVNTIASQAWFEVDMRSSDAASLASLESSVAAALDRAAAQENRRWGGRGAVTVEKVLVGDRPAGETAEAAPIVQLAVSVTRSLGLEIELGEGSTDANLPMSQGIPAITIDGGGQGTGGHTTAEAFDPRGAFRGTQRALLLVLALARD